MKKLLVLMLVLGMATLANAAFVISAVGPLNAETGISIDGDTDGVPLYVIVVSDGTLSSLDNAALGAAAPGMSGYFSDAGGGDWNGLPLPDGFAGGSWIMASAPPPSYPTGNYLNLDCAYTGQATVNAYWFDENTGMYGDIGQVVLGVPEPITMTLLGLGGLFLRRRK